jgi:hypothetical protein
MSIKTWEDEFMPHDARSKWALANPLRHALCKWRGLLPENLEKHGVVPEWNNYGGSTGGPTDTTSIVDESEDVLSVAGASDCTFCELHMMEVEDNCVTCPLFIARNGFKCYSRTIKEKTSPYNAWLYDADAQPMVELLESLELPPESEKGTD